MQLAQGQLAQGQVGAVEPPPPGSGPLAVRFGGNPPYLSTYHLARVGPDVQPPPTSAERGWCRPGDCRLTSAPTPFCADRAAYGRVLAAPTGGAPRRHPGRTGLPGRAARQPDETGRAA